MNDQAVINTNNRPTKKRKSTKYTKVLKHTLILKCVELGLETNGTKSDLIDRINSIEDRNYEQEQINQSNNNNPENNQNLETLMQEGDIQETDIDHEYINQQVEEIYPEQHEIDYLNNLYDEQYDQIFQYYSVDEQNNSSDPMFHNIRDEQDKEYEESLRLDRLKELNKINFSENKFEQPLENNSDEEKQETLESKIKLDQDDLRKARLKYFNQS